MKCLNCGCENEHDLCDSCRTVEILDKIFEEIRTYKQDTCENPYLAEYASGLTEKYEERKIIPEILELFNKEINEYYYCRYLKMTKDDRFEETAVTYIQAHNLDCLHTQRVMFDLIDSYLRNDFIKPKKWCQIIAETDGLCSELYAIAAEYFSMIGDYDIADSVADKGIERCKDVSNSKHLFRTPENALAELEKRKDSVLRYRTIKPYWPTTEERRRAVAMFYDERGIEYPRIDNRPAKIPENEFSPIKECFEDNLNDYCAFWCSEAFSVVASKSIYQIGAVKVRDNEAVDTFESFIRPWDGKEAARKAAAKEVGVSLDVIESAEDVDIVIKKFFDFVGGDILVSTEALGNQAKLISRAARYSGMKEIRNEFFDVLDMAADVSPDFDLTNNTREYLLSHFAFEEGKTALEKAKINKSLYDALAEFGD